MQITSRQIAQLDVDQAEAKDSQYLLTSEWTDEHGLRVIWANSAVNRVESAVINGDKVDRTVINLNDAPKNVVILSEHIAVVTANSLFLYSKNAVNTVQQRDIPGIYTVFDSVNNVGVYAVTRCIDEFDADDRIVLQTKRLDIKRESSKYGVPWKLLAKNQNAVTAITLALLNGWSTLDLGLVYASQCKFYHTSRSSNASELCVSLHVTRHNMCHEPRIQ